MTAPIPETRSPDYVYFRVDPTSTNYVNRIIEGYEYMGVLTTIDREKGNMMLRTTPDTKPLALQVLQTLPEVLEIFEESVDKQ